MSDQRTYPEDFRLLLASQSPRRRELLAAVGVPFEVVASTGREIDSGDPPAEVAEENALAKALGVPAESDEPDRCFILGTDTIVVVGGRILGKPSDREQARMMLASLSGVTHEVISGVALVYREFAHTLDTLVSHALTRVRFRPLQVSDIEAYLDSGEWEGKAGAYALQGRAALFVEGIEGEYANVVGLPLALLVQLFRQQGFDLLRREWCAGEESTVGETDLGLRSRRHPSPGAVGTGFETLA